MFKYSATPAEGGYGWLWGKVLTADAKLAGGVAGGISVLWIRGYLGTRHCSGLFLVSNPLVQWSYPFVTRIPTFEALHQPRCFVLIEEGES